MKEITISSPAVLPVSGEYDVVVVGGGVAGCSAALASVRSGMKTLLIEKQTILGGLATSGHVVIYLPLDDGYGRQVIGGIAEELLYDSVKYSYGDDVSNWQCKKRYETRFNGPAFALALEQKLLDEDVTVLYDTLFAASLISGKRCEGIIVENKSGRSVILAKAVVDASGDAEVFARASIDCRRAENSLAIWCYTTSDCVHVLKRGSAPERGLNLLTLGNIDTKAAKHVVIEPYYGDSADGVNRFILDGHKRLLDEICEHPEITLASLPGMAQFRMVRCVHGEHTLTEADLSRHFDDNIGATGDWRRPAPIYEIPFRALYTEASDNILAAGRCISSEGDAWQVTRVIPPAALTGQAAGTAAAMICQTGLAASQLPVSKLRKKLSAAGVILDCNKQEVN